MKLKKDEMILPQNVTMLDENEMEYVEGGSATITISPACLDKEHCRQVAHGLLSRGKVKGISQYNIAAEIFGHAVAYYMAKMAIDAGFDAGIVRAIASHANPVNIADRPDTFASIFDQMWRTLPSMYI